MPIETWRLLDIGPIEPLYTQIIYDVIAQGITEGISENTLIICWPSSPLVSLGYFQETEKDVDLEFCRKNNIVVTRRVVGGGGVYLDEGQMFYQIIHRKDSPVSIANVDKYYKKFLEAPVQAYRNLGIDAEFKPVNDIQSSKGQKISGNGAADVGDARILVGNLIFDFNFDMMVKVLKVPDEKFRDKLSQGLRMRMSTINQELGELPDRNEVKKDLLRLFKETLDIDLKEGSLTEWEKSKITELKEQYLSDEWLHWRSGGRIDARTVRLTATTIMGTANHKATGGLMRVTQTVDDEKISEIVISGDFFVFPGEALRKIEENLIGASVEGDEI
ncbi:MAG: biotin/lipoate A/B protein ligase family protein, partial [Candidatus Thorarchaeota archaeon]|nr:biotin/lipoate A/B protein ligase family protein [Candidatus Thorarchaeota archaeon]